MVLLLDSPPLPSCDFSPKSSWATSVLQHSCLCCCSLPSSPQIWRHLSHKLFLGDNYIPNYFQLINLACLRIGVTDINAELFIDQPLKFHFFPFCICHSSSSFKKESWIYYFYCSIQWEVQHKAILALRNNLEWICQVSMSLGRPTSTLQANFTVRIQGIGADTIWQKSLKLIIP